MEPALRYEAIKSGNVQIIEAYSTDSKVVTYKLKILEDDKRLFPPYQAAPLLSKETLEKYPELEQVLGVLAGKNLDRGDDADELCGRCGRQVGRASGEGIFRTRRIVKIGENHVKSTRKC